MQEQPTQFTEYRTVQKFLGDLAIKDYTESEIQERLGILEEFCTFVDRTPDQMVEEIFDVETRKYKKRNFYSSSSKGVFSTNSGILARANGARQCYSQLFHCERTPTAKRETGLAVRRYGSIE